MADDDVLEQILKQEDRWDTAVEARWPSFVKTFLVAAFLLFAGGIATNMLVNPRGEFKGALLPPVSGEDAAYKADLLARQHPAPDVLVLGSSRMQKIDPQEILRDSNRTAFNFAVAGTQPADSLRIYQGLAQRGYHFKEILVGLDINRIEPHEDEHRTQVAFGPLHSPDASAFDALAAGVGSFRFLYLRDSAISLYESFGGSIRHEITFSPDGLAHFTTWEREQAAGTFDFAAGLKAAIGPGGYHAYQGLDPVQVDAIRTLVADARANGTTVRLVITPIHVKLELGYERYGPSAYPPARRDVVSLVQSLCQEGVHAFNYTRAASFNGIEDGFFDGVHYTAENAARLIQGVYADRGDLCP